VARATSKWDYSFVHYDPEGFATVIDDNKIGFLKCNDCAENWCRHIELAINQNEDAETLWQIFDKELDDEGGSLSIYVPISPKNKLWAVVDFQRSALIPGVMNAFLVRPERPPIMLGFFNRGDGRLVMRSVILDWFMSLDSYPECADGTHGWQAERNWQANLLNSTTKWYEYWCVYFYEKCLTCFQKNMNLDFSDLIPDDPKPKYSDGGMVPF
jgi:hypothetical protein